MAKQLTGKKTADKEALWEKELVVHSIVDVEVAEALIDRFRRPRAGGSRRPRAGGCR